MRREERISERISQRRSGSRPPTPGGPFVPAPADWTDGASVVLSGSGFGAGPIIGNLVYDEFSRHAGAVENDDIDIQANVGAWSYVNVPPNHPAPTYDSLSLAPHSGNSAIRTIDGARYGTNTQALRLDRPSFTEFFCSWCEAVPDGYRFPGAPAEREFGTLSNWKQMWVMCALCGGEPTQTNDTVLRNWVVTNFTMGGNSWSPNGEPNIQLGTSDWEWNNWVRTSVWMKKTGTNTGLIYWQGLADGVASRSMNIRERVDKRYFFTSPYNWDRLDWCPWTGNWRDSPAATVRTLFDTCYFTYGPGSASRIEIGDDAVYESCKRLALCTPTAWSDGSIAFTVRRQSFPANSDCWFFVSDANNNRTVYPLGVIF